MACSTCGAKVWHFAYQVGGAFLWRAVEHQATCGRTCSNGYTEGHGHQQLAHADLHWPGCGQCDRLEVDRLKGMIDKERRPIVPESRWPWPFGGRR
jgi:hypothetical protein